MLTQKDIDWLKSEFLRDLAEAVAKIINDKLDRHYVLLDKTFGEVKAMRETQEMHHGDHDRIDGRLDRLEKKANLPPIID